jgi:Virulence factor membrane-bound polymerase, C-terminal/O-Antigen ligase
MLPAFFGSNPFASGILSRVTESNLVCTSRLTLWSNVLHLVSQRPWLGWGWSEVDYAHFITLYPGERFCEILDNAHNLPLHLAVELGIPVALVFCGACAWMVWRNKPWAETVPTRQLAWGVLAVIGLHSMLEYPLWYGPFQLAVVLCIWLLWHDSEADAELAQGPLLVRIATYVAAVTLMVFCAYAAWDYWRISQIYLPPSTRHAAYKEDAMAKIQGSWLFRDHVRFAELTTTPLGEDNAAHLHALAKAMLHFSPEPRVVEKVIEGAMMLHQDDEALFYLQRYKAAFPVQHARWRAALKVTKPD